MMRTTLAFFTALTLAAAASAQASITTFGSGCALQGQTPSIGSTGTPRIGQSFSLTYSGPNYQFSSAQQVAQPVLALGVQPAQFVLPVGNLLYQPVGCTGYLVPITLTPMPAHPNLPRYENSYSIAVPNNPGLIGYQLLGQWLLVHQQCGFVGCGLSALITSDAAIITIGQ